MGCTTQKKVQKNQVVIEQNKSSQVQLEVTKHNFDNQAEKIKHKYEHQVDGKVYITYDNAFQQTGSVQPNNSKVEPHDEIAKLIKIQECFENSKSSNSNSSKKSSSKGEFVIISQGNSSGYQQESSGYQQENKSVYKECTVFNNEQGSNL